MKGNVMPSIVKIEANELEQLVKEVKETVATDVIRTNTVQNNKSFGAVDLWSIHKRKKTASLANHYGL